MANDKLSTYKTHWHPCRRARPGATVSMPLTWTQAQSNLDPKRFTVRTVPALLAKVSASSQGAETTQKE